MPMCYCCLVGRQDVCDPQGDRPSLCVISELGQTPPDECFVGRSGVGHDREAVRLGQLDEKPPTAPAAPVTATVSPDGMARSSRASRAVNAFVEDTKDLRPPELRQPNHSHRRGA
jgi:hypothetical protein